MLETLKYILGSVGPSGYGSKTTADLVTISVDLRSITAIITGATSGIGAETARTLASRGARLILPARSVKAGEDGKARILSEFPDSTVLVMPLDLSSLASVRRFVSDFLALDLPLHLLINNAGTFPSRHAISEDGVEMTVATNYLGHFLLTKLLVKKMVDTAEATGIQARIVNVSSAIHTWFNGDIVCYLEQITRNKSEYDPTRAYAVSKLAMILHTRQLSIRLQGMKANVTANSVHPGVVRTRLTRDWKDLMTASKGTTSYADLMFYLGRKFLKTIPQAAATTCYVATHPALANVTGKYFADCNEATTSVTAANSSEAERLWAASELMVSRGCKSETPHV